METFDLEDFLTPGFYSVSATMPSAGTDTDLITSCILDKSMPSVLLDQIGLVSNWSSPEQEQLTFDPQTEPLDDLVLKSFQRCLAWYLMLDQSLFSIMQNTNVI